MEIILAKKDDLEFGVTKKFDGNFLVPIIKNVLAKAISDWDDYDEVFHCTRLIEQIKLAGNMSVDYHFIRRGNHIIGIFMATTGNLDYELFFDDTIVIPHKREENVIFNYFHVAPEGRGNGSAWLSEIIMDYYREKGLKYAYIKSSHPKVFSLYARLGREIGCYESDSDNHLHKREGKAFQIPLS